MATKSLDPESAYLRRHLPPFERLAKARPRDPDAQLALAQQLVLWSRGRTTWMRRARRLVQRALKLAPDRAELHALSGDIDDSLGLSDSALASMRRAVGLRPRDATHANYLARLVGESGAVRELAAMLPELARLHRIDLAAARRALRRAGEPTDPWNLYLSAFPVARSWFASRLAREAEKLERRLLPEKHETERRRLLSAALASRRANRLRASAVPPELRALVPLARRWGIGDDADRALLLERITPDERREIRRALTASVRRRIDAWLDTHRDGATMPHEAAAFMSLLEAFEELR